MTITPGDTHPGSPHGNESLLIPPDSPQNNSTIQALLDLAATNPNSGNPPSPPILPRVPVAYSKLPKIFTNAIKPIYTGSVPSFFIFLF